jgi:hypothetical protein
MSYNPHTWRKNNPEKRLEQKRREKVRTALRKRGILPPPGEEMNQEQQLINDQISNNDFTYWDSIKSRTTKSGKNDKQIKVVPNDYEYIKKDKSNENLKKKSSEFNLKKSDIITPTHCPYLGIKLSYDKKDEKLDNYRSIDRIDSSKGYVKGNLQVISHLANTIKKSVTIEQLIFLSKNVLKIHISDFRDCP